MSADDHWWYRPIRSVHRCGLRLGEGLEHELHEVAASVHPNETGGLLLGWWTGHVPVAVSFVEVPDPTARRNRWSRDEASAAAALEQARARYPPHVGYVGDWHSHPADVGPSQADIRAIRRCPASTTTPSRSPSSDAAAGSTPAWHTLGGSSPWTP